MRETEAAFHWITTLLAERGIQFRITGGLAAKVYGSTRELADIDIEISKGDFASVLPLIAQWVTIEPHHYRDESWDIFLLTLVYKGQEIDLAAYEQVRLFDVHRGVWVDADFSLAAEEHVCYGARVPVIPLAELIRYKMVICRDVDKEDVAILIRERDWEDLNPRPKH